LALLALGAPATRTSVAPDAPSLAGQIALSSVSCAAPGNCVAGGSFGGAYVLNEVHGVWGKARAVAVNLFRGGAGITSVSCESPGSCAAAGDGFGNPNTDTFLVDEVHGTWRQAFLVDDLGLQLNAVSCGAAGNCVAGGDELVGQDSSDAFAMAEINGHWGRLSADPVFNGDVAGTFSSVSCSSVGNCALGGQEPTFLMIEKDGRWGSAFRVSSFLGGAVTSVSCAAEGDCAVGGITGGLAGSKVQGFVVSEANGHRGNAIEIRINMNGQETFTPAVSVSCGLPGNCAAGGTFTDSAGKVQGFVMNEVHGHWTAFRPIRGLAALNTGGFAYVTSVSCASAGNCTAGGGFTSPGGIKRPFVVTERNGRWGTAIRVPGAPGSAAVESVSCASPGNCAAVGRGFVVSQTNGRWHRAILVNRPT
jgi:hypothetical protein